MPLISQYGCPQSLWTRLPSAAKAMPEYRVWGERTYRKCLTAEKRVAGRPHIKLIREWCWGVGYVRVRTPNIGGVAARTPKKHNAPTFELVSKGDKKRPFNSGSVPESQWIPFRVHLRTISVASRRRSWPLLSTLPR